MPVRSANPQGPRSSPRRRTPDRKKAPAGTGPAARAAAEPFRVASRDRLIPRQRDGAPEEPRVSYEVILAVAIVVACMCGAMAVGAAFTLQV
jgi:hypothetical protein